MPKETLKKKTTLNKFPKQFPDGFQSLAAMMRIKICKDGVAQKQLGKIGGQSGILLLPSGHFKHFSVFRRQSARIWFSDGFGFCCKDLKTCKGALNIYFVEQATLAFLVFSYCVGVPRIEASLLTAMETCGKDAQLSDETQKQDVHLPCALMINLLCMCLLYICYVFMMYLIPV